MADVKISALTAIAAASITATDILPIVDDIGGTPTTYSMTMAQVRTAVLQAAVGSGWGATDYLGLGSGTVPSSGMIRVGQGTLTGSSAPLINSTATWDNAATTFTHIFANITNTTSNAASMLIDLQVGGSTMFNVTRAGVGTFTGGWTAAAACAITAASATAFAVGRQGTTAPALLVHSSTASQATGVQITGKAAASGVAIAAISSGTDENLTVDAKGSGTVTLAGNSTGGVVVSTSLSVGSTIALGGVAADASVGVLTLGLTTSTATDQYSFYAASTASTAATVSGTGVHAYVVTAAGSFTMTDAYAFRAANGSKGAGSAITNYYGLYVDSITSGATLNYAIYTNTGVVRFGGTAYVGDDSNANITLGLTLNQGANDDQILALKSSDVAHGITDNAETDTFGAFKKYTAADGGLRVDGFSEVTLAAVIAGNYTTSNTTKTVGGDAAIGLFASKKSGTGVGNPGADDNLVAIYAGSTTRFLFDNEGSGHADVEWVAF